MDSAIPARRKKDSWKPSSGRPKTTSTKTRVSGVFRTRSTYVAPAHRSGGAGATRIAASTVPRTRATVADSPVSRIVVQNPRRMTSNWSTNTSTSEPPAAADPGPAHRGSGAGVDGRRRRLAAALAERVVVRLLPRAVVDRTLD